MTKSLTSRQLLNRIRQIGSELKGYTEKLVVSFIGVKAYWKVQNNQVKETDGFTKENIGQAEPTVFQIHEIAGGQAKLRNHWSNEGWQLMLATCAGQVDLSAYGVGHNCCIDDELMERIFAEGHELVYYLHTGELPGSELFSGQNFTSLPSEKLKDKG